jgi:hypothetical protein
MLGKLIELLTALSVAVGGHGLATAAGHADPNAADRALQAVAAVVTEIGDVASESTHGLALALTKVSNERALQALNDAAAAKAAGQAKAQAARAAHGSADSAPVQAPPVDTPPASGRPAHTPPFDTPPVPVPPRP